MHRKNRSKPWFRDCKDEKWIRHENRVRTKPQQAKRMAGCAQYRYESCVEVCDMDWKTVLAQPMVVFTQF